MTTFLFPCFRNDEQTPAAATADVVCSGEGNNAEWLLNVIWNEWTYLVNFNRILRLELLLIKYSLLEREENLSWSKNDGE